jgi:hypothetical protein
VIMKKIIVGGLKSNIILENKECVVGLSVCLPSHLPLTKLFICTKFSGVYMCTINMRLITQRFRALSMESETKKW